MYILLFQGENNHVCTQMMCRGDQLMISHQLLYHIMTLLKSCTDQSFEIVIDLTHATQLNEPDVSLRGEGVYCTTVARTYL